MSFSISATTSSKILETFSLWRAEDSMKPVLPHEAASAAPSSRVTCLREREVSERSQGGQGSAGLLGCEWHTSKLEQCTVSQITDARGPTGKKHGSLTRIRQPQPSFPSDKSPAQPVPKLAAMNLLKQDAHRGNRENRLNRSSATNAATRRLGEHR